MVKYEYEAKENNIYIDYKDEVSKTKIVEYYKSKQLEGEPPLKRFLDGFIADNQDFQKFLKNLFRKGVQILYGQKIENKNIFHIRKKYITFDSIDSDLLLNIQNLWGKNLF